MKLKARGVCRECGTGLQKHLFMGLLILMGSSGWSEDIVRVPVLGLSEAVPLGRIDRALKEAVETHAAPVSVRFGNSGRTLYMAVNVSLAYSAEVVTKAGAPPPRAGRTPLQVDRGLVMSFKTTEGSLLRQFSYHMDGKRAEGLRVYGGAFTPANFGPVELTVKAGSPRIQFEMIVPLAWVPKDQYLWCHLGWREGTLISASPWFQLDRSAPVASASSSPSVRVTEEDGFEREGSQFWFNGKSYGMLYKDGALFTGSRDASSRSSGETLEGEDVYEKGEIVRQIMKHPGGGISREIQFLYGLPDKGMTWYANGVKGSEAVFQFGQIASVSAWNDEGKKLREESFQDGAVKKRTRFSPDSGLPVEEEEFEERQPLKKTTWDADRQPQVQHFEIKRPIGVVAKPNWLGLMTKLLNSDEVKQLGEKSGAKVISISPNSPAQASGLKIGDVILSLEGQTVRDNQSLSTLIKQFSVGSQVRMHVWRGGQSLTLQANVEAQP